MSLCNTALLRTQTSFAVPPMSALHKIVCGLLAASINANPDSGACVGSSAPHTAALLAAVSDQAHPQRRLQGPFDLHPAWAPVQASNSTAPTDLEPARCPHLSRDCAHCQLHVQAEEGRQRPSHGGFLALLFLALAATVWLKCESEKKVASAEAKTSGLWLRVQNQKATTMQKHNAEITSAHRQYAQKLACKDRAHLQAMAVEQAKVAQTVNRMNGLQVETAAAKRDVVSERERCALLALAHEKAMQSIQVELASARAELAETVSRMNSLQVETAAAKRDVVSERERCALLALAHEKAKQSIQVELASARAELADAHSRLASLSEQHRVQMAELASEREVRQQLQYQLGRCQQTLLSQLQHPPAQHSETLTVALQPDDPKYAALEEMFQASMARHRLKLGSDHWCDPPKVLVTGISEFIHGHKLQEYEQVRRARSEDCAEIHGVTAFKCVVGHGWCNLNEYLLYHGTGFRKTDDIARSGFDAQRGGETTGAMFGRGVYFAQNASKSDLYTTCRQCVADDFRSCRHAQGERRMLVSRVLLGESLVKKETNDLVRGWIKAPDRPNGIPYDSITAACRADGGAVDHMEFVVFKDPRMLVQYHISYRHDASCQCSCCHRRRG